MAGITVDSLRTGIGRIAPHMASCAAKLNEADGKLGDGDLGITMDRGMAALSAISDDLPDDVGMAFLQCAKEFTRISGSSYGTLFATALMSAAKACKGNEEIGWSRVSALLGGVLEAMMQRGKGALGDKTVLDCIEAARVATDGLDEPQALLEAVQEAIVLTMAEFRGKKSRLGRARMYGDKSIGLDDPGMLALACVVDGLAK